MSGVTDFVCGVCISASVWALGCLRVRLWQYWGRGRI